MIYTTRKKLRFGCVKNGNLWGEAAPGLAILCLVEGSQGGKRERADVNEHCPMIQGGVFQQQNTTQEHPEGGFGNGISQRAL